MAPSWENHSPSPELHIHLRGLQHLVGMVGESALEESGFRPMIFWYDAQATSQLYQRDLCKYSQDYVSAVCADTRPVLVDLPSIPQLRQIHSTSLNIPVNTCCPLLSFPDSSVDSDYPLPRIALEESFYALETLYFHSHAPHSLLLATFGDRAIAKLQSLRVDTDHASVDIKIGQACRLAAQIHIRAASRLIPHRDAANIGDLQALHDILQTLDIHDWKHMPYVLLWV
jgi:hypothetical protein